jgi:hypothetical protein
LIDEGSHEFPVLALLFGLALDLTQLAAEVESAILALPRSDAQNCLNQARRDSQGSLPKTAVRAYLDDNATEL